MEQPCYKCGQSVEEGVPFCPHCSAPQIRVAIAEPMSVPAAGDAALSSPSVQNTTITPGVTLPLQWPQALSACAGAALLAALAMVLGLTFPAAVVGAGFLAVALYSRHNSGTMRAGRGAQLGAISGVFCFAITAVFLALASTAPDVRTKIRGQIIEGAEKWASARPADPQVQAALEQLKTQEGLVMMLIIGGIVFSVIFVALASLGGALGGAILGRRDKV
jgi:hypothetical protein